MTDTTSSPGGTDECIAQTYTAPGRFLLPSCFRFSNKTFSCLLYSLIFFEFQIPDSGFRIPDSWFPGFRVAPAIVHLMILEISPKQNASKLKETPFGQVYASSKGHELSEASVTLLIKAVTQTKC